MNRIRKTIAGAALVGTAVVGGYVGISSIGAANAATNDTTATTTAPSADATAPTGTPPNLGAPPADGSAPTGTPPSGAPAGPHMANGKTETVLTGDDASKATEAALAASPGATVDRVETDADGATYEAHITKADGTKATVKMDANFAVTSVEDGMR